ncbi:KOW motif domain-containing protein [Roseimicrobium sp. ORNL1]|uniref:KOW motif domain-containing protein n=1 Tax=Roseimicrobium sp. ORNL1 TaxID=2711231 RepID=UPI0013E1B52D|nr:KOW motif domain-containing protein [Roseimicrobium sp. ORNL1]QIF03527.1 50S ribosomal protein L24 [Roseimicrobium sp. ORNL1]
MRKSDWQHLALLAILMSREEMKPALHNRLLAYTWEFSISMGIASAIGFMLLIFHHEGALIWDWFVIGMILLTAVPTAGIGYFFGAIYIWMILGHVAARIQGAPFSKGDEVMVLSGKHKGRVTRIYQVWEPRGQIRLELGEEAKKAVTDVVCIVTVTRTRCKESAQAVREHPAGA